MKGSNNGSKLEATGRIKFKFHSNASIRKFLIINYNHRAILRNGNQILTWSSGLGGVTKRNLFEDPLKLKLSFGFQRLLVPFPEG